MLRLRGRTPQSIATTSASSWAGHMASGVTLSFTDPDGYAAAFGDACIKLAITITGTGDFKARLMRLKLEHLEIYRCSESLPRIAYISLPAEPVFLSFPVGKDSCTFDGIVLRNGDMVFHSSAECLHQRSSGACQWGFISLSADQLASSSKALTGQAIASPALSRILRPLRAEIARFQVLFEQACHLAENGQRLIEHVEIARALEQEMLHAIVHCLAANQADESSNARHHHAALMVRFEETLGRHIDQKLSMPALCAEVGVAERTLRMCCAEFLGTSPSRYLLLQRLNKARAALRRADPSKATVAEVARNHHFLELGRFSVTYRTAFGELPSVTLQRNPRT
jgi:AraC-like DNA-binding protein